MVWFFSNYGRFLGSQELILVPQAENPNFVKTNILLSAIELFREFNCPDAGSLISIYALGDLNIYYGRSSQVSKDMLRKFLHNLTFQALTKENDEILIEFDKIANVLLK